MDDFNSPEESAPFDRAEPNADPRRKPGAQVVLASDYRDGSRNHSSMPHFKFQDLRKPPSRARVAKAVFLSLAALSALSVSIWIYIGVRDELLHLHTDIVLTKSSLSELEDVMNDLDRDRMNRLALLADSIRSVFDYAQNESQVWHQRLDENDRAITIRLDGLAGVDRAQRLRIDALERQDLTHSSAFAALGRRAQTQESATAEVSASVSWLRTALSKLDDELVALAQRLAASDQRLAASEQRQAASSTAYGQLGKRVESVSSWADGFRQAGLSGESVQGRFSALNAELRRIRLQVDSLRPIVRAITISEPR